WGPAGWRQQRRSLPASTACAPDARGYDGLSSSLSPVDGPLPGRYAGSAGEPEVHQWTVRDEDGGVAPALFAHPVEEDGHEAEVRRRVHCAERLVEEQQPRAP